MLKIGKITKTHGIKGEVKAIYFTDSPEFFKNLKRLTLMPPGVSVGLISSRARKNALILRLEGINSIEEAEPFIGCEILIDREEAPPLPPDRYYVEDILGLLVKCEDGRELGRVTKVFTAGGGDVYEVRGEREYLIPTHVITEYNLDGGYILINPIKGLLDDEE